MERIYKKPFFWIAIILLLAITVWPGWLWGHPLWGPWENEPRSTTETHSVSECQLPTQVFPGYRFNPVNCAWEIDPAYSPTATSMPTTTPRPMPTTATSVPPTAFDSSFGTGTCYSNGASFTLVSNADSVESAGFQMNDSLAKYGGQCVVDTYRDGFLYAVSATSITWNGQSVSTNPPAMGIPALTGHWVITFSAPKPGKRNDSNGLMFKLTPSVNDTPAEQLFAQGTCVVNGIEYNLYVDDANLWQEGMLLQSLVQNGGVCNFTTYKDAWYWSVAGNISHNNTSMPNGQCLFAPAGQWTIVFAKPGKNNGFAFHVDKSPYRAECP